MNRKNAFVQFVLMPFALLYSLAAGLRNLLFDLKILPSQKYDVPIICIGNIAVGGTGKTPFTEYLIALLKKQARVATLSRGYKRRTKGFVWVSESSTDTEAGDEACQLKQKFPDIHVAVDANRRRGIRRLLSLPEDERPEVILLDDAMQHRYVTPSLTIMLTDYHNMYYNDRALPAGNLRESAKGAHRADIIIVTKCPDVIAPNILPLFMKNMMLKERQRLYFTKIKYHPLEALYPSFAHQPCSLNEMDDDVELLLITGIANPQPFIDTIKSHYVHNKVFSFPDHHRFTLADIQDINAEFQKITSENKRIITTGKDAVRLKTLAYLPDEWKPVLYYLPMSVEFLVDQGDDFNARIVTINKI